MGYDWEDKRDICYQLYVVERKPLDAVVDYFKERLTFTPSKRTFQTQFKKWDFPTKIEYTHKDERVVERVRQLWEQNMMQKEMIPILMQEGFHVTESSIMRLRAKHGMHLKNQSERSTKVHVDEEGTAHDNMSPQQLETESQISHVQPSLKRKVCMEDLLVDNEQKLKQKKRRRHTKEWNGMPADPPQPPRYPSETTIGEAQNYLGLNDEMYKEVRELFRNICLEREIIKKSLCGSELWLAAKDLLILEYPYLQQVFHQSDDSTRDPLLLSLDIICIDVTKNIRVREKTMSLAEAKNTIGLNPLQSRELKQKLVDLLEANNFVNTYKSENWKELKEQWLEGTIVNERMPLDDGAIKERYEKAIQLICRDTLKRWRESLRSTKKKGSNVDHIGNAASEQDGTNSRTTEEFTSIQSQPLGEESNTSSSLDQTASSKQVDYPAMSSHAATAVGSYTDFAMEVQGEPGEKLTEISMVHKDKNGHSSLDEKQDDRIQIDPSLLTAAMSSDNGTSNERTFHDYPLLQTAELALTPPSLPVYFRRGLNSENGHIPSLWLASINNRLLSSLRDAALSFKHGQHYEVDRLEAVSINNDGQESLYHLNRDEDLQAYLVHNEGRKATFVADLHPRVMF